MSKGKYYLSATEKQESYDYYLNNFNTLCSNYKNIVSEIDELNEDKFPTTKLFNIEEEEIYRDWLNVVSNLITETQRKSKDQNNTLIRLNIYQTDPKYINIKKEFLDKINNCKTFEEEQKITNIYLNPINEILEAVETLLLEYSINQTKIGNLYDIPQLLITIRNLGIMFLVEEPINITTKK